MPRQRYTYFMRATIWTPTMKMQSEGSPDGVITTAFHAVQGHDKRAKLLESLKVIDAEMTDHELRTLPQQG